jgi:hypothetical protein
VSAFVVADGTPAEHVTSMVTSFVVDSKCTLAVAAGPRETLSTS